MKALVDRHQADLYYALQLLLEDRLGLEIYTPVGYEWFDEGYWNFGRAHMGRDLADQYLRVDAKYELHIAYATPEPHPAHYGTFDPAHPEREIMGVTREQFATLGPWDYIVATVQDNQEGFARLAREVGAKYVLQIGNTRQGVSWELDPLALMSSEVPPAGRHVLMHQELASCFRYRDPAEAEQTISSFVNLMPRLPDWPLWVGYQTMLPEWSTRVYGIDGPDGNLHPVEAVADAMAKSAFGLHLKPTGDGFGHVIHGWAAIGRPLIGRASYYRGQLAERFWQDGVTAIDLEQRSPQENVDLIRAIWADPEQYRAMCQAIRREFDQIDYPAEAEAVRALLGIPERTE